MLNIDHNRKELTKDTPYLALTGKLWSAFCDYFREKSCYEAVWLYEDICSLHDILIFVSLPHLTWGNISCHLGHCYHRLLFLSGKYKTLETPDFIFKNRCLWILQSTGNSTPYEICTKCYCTLFHCGYIIIPREFYEVSLPIFFMIASQTIEQS